MEVAEVLHKDERAVLLLLLELDVVGDPSENGRARLAALAQALDQIVAFGLCGADVRVCE